jgi:hypothetical protein
MKATTPLTVKIEVPAEQTYPVAFRVILRLTNETAYNVLILNPDMGKPIPATSWPWSRESYGVSLLISFRYLAISVTDEVGQIVPRQPLQSMATPVRLPDVELTPGKTLDLPIPIGEFYRLDSGKTYDLKIEYGDRDRKVAAQALIAIP